MPETPANWPDGGNEREIPERTRITFPFLLPLGRSVANSVTQLDSLR